MDLKWAEVKSKAEEWLTLDPFEKTKKEIQTLLDEKNIAELSKRLLNRINFGTAGLRSRMGAGFAYMNNLIIIQTTQVNNFFFNPQGLCEYLLKVQPEVLKTGVVIGYDHRHNSTEFAHWTAKVFLTKNIPVHWYSSTVATPFVPFAVSQLKCAAGIMITASHNPKDDNGYKLYWNNGAQIIPPIDADIQSTILKNLQVWESVHNVKIENNDLINDITEKIPKLYFDAIPKLSQKVTCTENITYTAMHGVGTKWIDLACKSFNIPEFIKVKEQVEPDPDFPTVTLPNPEEGKGALKLAISCAEKNDSHVILANDPDADRLAVAEKHNGEWKILNGNQIALLLADWVFKHYKGEKKAAMLASTVSSKVLSSMANVEGFRFDDTLTGFKWIGNKAYELSQEGYEILLAYEVEIGFLISDISFDKDGIRTAVVFAEMINELYKTTTLSDHLDKLYSKYGYFMMKTRYFFCPPEKLNGIFERVRTMNNGSYPNLIGGKFKIKSVRDITTGYDSSQKDLKTTLPTTPDSQMITFYFEDGSTCTLRNSGTEPKVKYYVEGNKYQI